jgi:hypothetical protein
MFHTYDCTLEAAIEAATEIPDTNCQPGEITKKKGHGSTLSLCGRAIVVNPI